MQIPAHIQLKLNLVKVYVLMLDHHVTSSLQKSGSAQASSGDIPLLMYGHLNSVMPTSSHDGLITFASGEAPSQSLVRWMMNSHFCVVSPQ